MTGMARKDARPKSQSCGPNRYTSAGWPMSVMDDRKLRQARGQTDGLRQEQRQTDLGRAGGRAITVFRDGRMRVARVLTTRRSNQLKLHATGNRMEEEQLELAPSVRCPA